MQLGSTNLFVLSRKMTYKPKGNTRSVCLSITHVIREKVGCRSYVELKVHLITYTAQCVYLRRNSLLLPKLGANLCQVFFLELVLLGVQFSHGVEQRLNCQSVVCVRFCLFFAMLYSSLSCHYTTLVLDSTS